jgi:hypothetical protein
LGLYVIKLEDGRYSEALALNVSGIQAVTVFVNSFGAYLSQVGSFVIVSLGLIISLY